MKKILLIFIFITFYQTNGQVEKDSISSEFKFISYYLISDSCNKISNWYEKKKCSRNQIENQFREEFYKSDLIDKLPKNEYRIWLKFIIDEKRILSDIDIQTENSELKAELKKILIKSITKYHLIDENGIIIKRRFSFPIEIKIE